MYDVCMRTTLTIDPEIAERLKQKAAMGKHSFKAIVNDALRKGLGLEPMEDAPPYQVRPHSSPFRPGVDPAKLNQLVDELEAGEFLSKHAPKS